MLTDEQIEKVRAEFAGELSKVRTSLSATKPQCIAVLAAVDSWVGANAASFNQALPQAVANNFSAKQKLKLLRMIINARLEAL